MTGYNTAHGDTAAVQLDLNNDQGAYTEYMDIIHRAAWWDEADNTWNDVDKAAEQVEQYVKELKRTSAGEIPEFGEIWDADLGSVNWEEIVTDVLEEGNIQAGRDRRAGL